MRKFKTKKEAKKYAEDKKEDIKVYKIKEGVYVAGTYEEALGVLESNPSKKAETR